MLAFKFADYKDKLAYPLCVQPKLNGIRMLYQAGVCQTRHEKVWASSKFPHIREALKSLPSNIILDGELYIHGKSLQQINSLCSVHPNAVVKANELDLDYHVFDCVDTNNLSATFLQRIDLLHRLCFFISRPVQLVPTMQVAEPSVAEQAYSDYKANGYEGLMYRDSSSPYGLDFLCSNKENRWKFLLKRKTLLRQKLPHLNMLPF